MPFRKEIFLVGHLKHQITGSKLPSRGDCLRVLFYNMRVVKLNFNESAALVVEECTIYWKKARVPTQEPHKCKLKLKKIYDTWQNLVKDKNKTSEIVQKKQLEFRSSLDDLFDIAHQNALEIITIQEDKQFLIKQREKGRTGFMVGVDRKITGIEKRKLERMEKENERKKLDMPSTSSDTFQWEDIILESEKSPSDSEKESNEEKEQEPTKGDSPVEKPKKRARKELLTPRLAAVLDKCKISERDSVHLIMAFMEAVSLDPTPYVINRTSIRFKRAHFRKIYFNDIKEEFSSLNTQAITVHWDTKLLQDISGKSVERLAVIATGTNVEQLLGVPDLPAATGTEMASAIYETLENWGLTEKVQAFGFDTTASNTGRIKGACTLLEQKLERNILFFGCRHHVLEIVLSAVFAKSKFTISGPDIPLFKRFQNGWSEINVQNFVPAVDKPEIKQIFGDSIDTILKDMNEAISKKFPREDYRELLELVIISLGGVPPGGISFKKPGAYHMARWMAKAIYSLKIFLFRTEFILTKAEEKSLLKITCFIIKCYVKYWIYAPEAISAPLMDIKFLRELNQYKEIDTDIAEVAIGKFINHLYYLTEECVTFALFDESITGDTKLKMAHKIIATTEARLEDAAEDDADTNFKKLPLRNEEISQFLQSSDEEILIKLLGKNSINLFHRYKIENFLNLHPSEWNNSNEYKQGKLIIGQFKVVNDSAERGIKLIQDFNTKVTKDEVQKQFLLQTVQDYRRKYPESTREVLEKHFNE